MRRFSVFFPLTVHVPVPSLEVIVVQLSSTKKSKISNLLTMISTIVQISLCIGVGVDEIQAVSSVHLCLLVLTAGGFDILVKARRGGEE